MPPLWGLPRNGLKITARFRPRRQKSPALCWAFFVYSFPKVRIIAPLKLSTDWFFCSCHRPPYTITNIYRLAFAIRSSISPWQPVDNFDSRRSSTDGKTPDKERLICRQRRRPMRMANSQATKSPKARSSLSLTTRFGKSKIKSKSVF